MSQIQNSSSRSRRLAAFIRRKWFGMPLVISMVVASSYWGWEYSRFRFRVDQLKSLDADFTWGFEESGPEWVRRYLGHPTNVWNNAGPIRYGPFDKVVKFTARNRGRHANSTLDQIRVITKFKHVRTLDLSYSAATDDWFPEIAKIRSLQERLLHTPDRQYRAQKLVRQMAARIPIGPGSWYGSASPCIILQRSKFWSVLKSDTLSSVLEVGKNQLLVL